MQTRDRQSQAGMSRRLAMPIITESQRTVEQSREKKWYGSRDSSVVIAKRRDTSMGISLVETNDYNVSTNTVEIANTIRSALRRSRG
jgi:hypothetical protein